MRLIDADRLLEFERFDAQVTGEEHTADDILMMIKTAPTVDAVPVIRCKECKTWSKGESLIFPGEHICYARANPIFTKSDDFCSYGERKEGADNA